MTYGGYQMALAIVWIVILLALLVLGGCGIGLVLWGISLIISGIFHITLYATLLDWCVVGIGLLMIRESALLITEKKEQN